MHAARERLAQQNLWPSPALYILSSQPSPGIRIISSPMDQLPDLVLLELLCTCSSRDLAVLSATCRRLQALACVAAGAAAHLTLRCCGRLLSQAAHCSCSSKPIMQVGRQSRSSSCTGRGLVCVMQNGVNGCSWRQQRGTRECKAKLVLSQRTLPTALGND